MPSPGKYAQTATSEDGIQSDLRSQGLVMSQSCATLELKLFVECYDKLLYVSYIAKCVSM
jgi:hypothetical protein